MKLDKLPLEAKEWTSYNFPNAAPWEPLVGMMEEIGELSHAHLKQHQRIRVSEECQEKKQDAIGDILIYMADYCNRNNIDMEECLERAWSEVVKRDWKKFPVNGVYE
jgi:NTP pyrophosphatase (non-canonical NTP hydrolase)